MASIGHRSLPEQIRVSSRSTEPASLRAQVHQHLDTSFSDVDFVLGHAGPSDHSASRRGKRRRNLAEEISHWEREEAAAERDLEKTNSTLPSLLAETQTKLQDFLSSAQELSVERYTVVEKLSGLLSELDETQEPLEGHEKGQTLLKQMEGTQTELRRLEAGLAWAGMMEQILTLSEKTLAPTSHRPSPLAALPHYRNLHALVQSLRKRLPPSMALLGVIEQVRHMTWDGLRGALSRNLLDACEGIKWPMRIQYHTLTTDQRRRFERAYSDLLYLQTERENLHSPPADATSTWSSGEALYPLQAMVEPISLRFRYHFQGTKSTNRMDKPEWAFANILDQIYEHTPFLTTILQPLTAQSGYPEIDVRSEFILALLPTVLNLLRSRIPLLLEKPALLAHTVYQTVLFDDAIREGGFDLSRTTAGNGTGEWEGLTGVILKEEGWFEQWLVGEKRFVDSQLHSILSNQDAWTISDETVDEDEREADGSKPTVSARQIKALIEQVTDRYSPLPALIHRFPFLLQIQLPTLQAYHQRINGSLDAFESISSAFARHIPGALAGNTRSGANFDQTRLTSGEAGLARLVKANLSAEWVLQALRGWADETFFVELSSDLITSTEVKWRIQDQLLPQSIRSTGLDEEGVSVFDVMVEKYEALCERSEDMMVRLVTSEVEQELREHLKRRWDQTPHTPSQPSSHLLSALATYTTLLRLLSTDLSPILLSRTYRRIVTHLVNHITQRAIYSGWSKFSLTGAKELKDEMTDFVVSSSDILSSIRPSGSISVVKASDMPWKPILDKIAILSLPTELSDAETQEGKPTFSQGMAAAWSDGPESLKGFLERVGVKMDRAELQAILRRREECWR